MSSSSLRSSVRKRRRQHFQDSENYVFDLPDIEEEEDFPMVNLFEELKKPVFLSSLRNSNRVNVKVETENQNQENIPDRVEFSEAVISSILSYPGVTLSAAERIVNLFNSYISRFSGSNHISLPSVRYFWEKRAKSNSIGCYVICGKEHSHGPFFGEPKNYGDYSCDGENVPVAIKPDKYFLYIPFRPQLEIQLPLLDSSCWDESGLNDLEISNSSEARRIKSTIEDSSIKKLTLTLHADEVAVGNSSNVTIFPIFLTINEMSKKFRKKNFFLVSLFVGRKKPPVEIFLGPIVEELQALENSPITWKSFDKIDMKTTCHLAAVIADAPMRAYLRNVRQFNHLNGCDWCLVTASSFQGARLYPNLEFEELSRLKRKKEDFQAFERFLENQDDSIDRERFPGIVGISPLLKLESFDIVNGFAVEPMHCIILGIFRSVILKGWLKVGLMGILEPGIDRNLFKNELGRRLKAIKVPSEFSRTTRDMNQIKYWKSAEYDSFLAYYFLPVMKGLIMPRIINNMLCLSRIYFLMHDSTMSNDVKAEVKNLVNEFQQGVTEFYGPTQQTYNLHILTHLPDSIDSLGPFANISAYPLENHMGLLKEKVRRTSNIAQNLVRVFLNEFKHREIQATKIKFWNIPANLKKQFGVESEDTLNVTKVPESHDFMVYQQAEIKDILLDNFGIYFVSRLQETKYFKSICINSIRYSTRDYCSDKTRDDSVVRLNTGAFFSIENICEVAGNFFFIGKEFKSTPVRIKFKGFTGEFDFTFSHIHEITKKMETSKLVKFFDIKKKSLFIKSQDFHPKYSKNYVIESFLENL